MKNNGWYWLAFLPILCSAQEIPQPVIPEGVGVNIHFTTGHENDLDLIASAGFHFIRMDFGWDGIERQKGKYNWSEYEELLANLDRHGIRAVLILDYSNPLYEEQVTSTNPLTHQSHQTTASPQHPESVAAYAKWAAETVTHFRGRHVLWELWNEPNIDFWSPKPDVHQYTTLALAACKAIRQADPHATIIGPATSTFPWDFLQTFLSSGVLEYLDAVSVHPYREPRRNPETATTDYHRLRELIEKYSTSDKKQKIPILSGEWGYSTWERGVTLETQAAFLVRQQLINLLDGVPLSIWYDWKNDGNNPKENEHNFGTVTSELEPKPAYTAIKTLTHELSGYRISGRQDLMNEQDYLLICTNSIGSQKLVAWTIGEPHQAKLPFQGDSKKLAAIRSNGQKFTLGFENGQCLMPLSPAPAYLTLEMPGR